MIANQSFWIDEGYSLYFSEGPNFHDTVSRLLETRLSDRYRILYYLIMFGWREIFGASEFAIRSFSAISGILGAIFVFFTAQYWFGKRHALWSFLLISVSAYCVYYSQEARDYSLAILLVSCQLFVISRAFSNHRIKFPILFRAAFAILSAVSIFLNILMLCFSGALSISHLLVTRRLKLWFFWWAPAAILSFSPLLFYLDSPTATSPTEIGVSRTYFPLIYNAIYVLYGLFAGTTFGPPQLQLRGDDNLSVIVNYWPQLLWLLITLTTIAIILLTVKLARWQSNKRYYSVELFLISSLFLSLIFGLFLAFVTKYNWVPRHACYTWPILAILLPVLLENRPSQESFKDSQLVNRLSHISLTFLIGINLFSLHNYYFNGAFYKDDFRSAAQYVIQNRDSETRSVLIGGAGDTYLLGYYGDPETLDGKYITNNLRTGDFADKIRELTDNSEKVLLVSNREYSIAQDDEVMQAMEILYDFEEDFYFNYFRIYHFEMK
ncbi:MAG: glycosyltransferase family 39 protein [Cyanobacteria bacterium J06639_14]